MNKKMQKRLLILAAYAFFVILLQGNIAKTYSEYSEKEAYDDWVTFRAGDEILQPIKICTSDIATQKINIISDFSSVATNAVIKSEVRQNNRVYAASAVTIQKDVSACTINLDKNSGMIDGMATVRITADGLADSDVCKFAVSKNPSNLSDMYINHECVGGGTSRT